MFLFMLLAVLLPCILGATSEVEVTVSSSEDGFAYKSMTGDDKMQRPFCLLSWIQIVRSALVGAAYLLLAPVYSPGIYQLPLFTIITSHFCVGLMIDFERRFQNSGLRIMHKYPDAFFWISSSLTLSIIELLLLPVYGLLALVALQIINIPKVLQPIQDSWARMVASFSSIQSVIVENRVFFIYFVFTLFIREFNNQCEMDYKVFKTQSNKIM